MGSAADQGSGHNRPAMRNLLDEKPTPNLHGRLKFAVDLVDDGDLLNKRVLDIGCGFGWFELNALARGASQIVGTEITKLGLRALNTHLVDPRLSTSVASATCLPFAAASFDTVVCWEVLEHIPANTEPMMFASVSRVLKAGGKFYLSTPHASLVGTLTDPAWWLIRHRHYSAAALRRLAAGTGLSVERLEVRGGLAEVAFTFNLYFSKWVLRRRPLAEAWFLTQINREYAIPGFYDLFSKFSKPACDR
jgi:2-polyprenyl-3-methyl-5-hydroxy-6-metoxy-1,4-benzoquinol methylase